MGASLVHNGQNHGGYVLGKLVGGATDLLNMCLRSTYFSYGGEFYEQRKVAAMGPLSRQLYTANLHTEFFEELSLQSAPVVEVVCG